MANGRVVTGFSKPYVALYSASEAGVVTYSNGKSLARGVDVNISPETSEDNKFYADNQAAENAAGTFTGGTITLTVDGLLLETERMIMGLPEASGDWTEYGDSQEIPYVGVGYIARYQSAGVVTYVPTIICKCMFNQIESAAATQEDAIDFQTQSLEANILRGDDANHNWKMIGKDYSTEAAAEAALKTKLGIS